MLPRHGGRRAGAGGARVCRPDRVDGVGDGVRGANGGGLAAEDVNAATVLSRSVAEARRRKLRSGDLRPRVRDGVVGLDRVVDDRRRTVLLLTADRVDRVVEEDRCLVAAWGGGRSLRRPCTGRAGRDIEGLDVRDGLSPVVTRVTTDDPRRGVVVADHRDAVTTLLSERRRRDECRGARRRRPLHHVSFRGVVSGVAAGNVDVEAHRPRARIGGALQRGERRRGGRPRARSGVEDSHGRHQRVGAGAAADDVKLGANRGSRVAEPGVGHVSSGGEGRSGWVKDVELVRRRRAAIGALRCVKGEERRESARTR